MQNQFSAYILGISHTVQTNQVDDQNKLNEYRNLLRTISIKYNINHFFEEFSIMALPRYHLKSTDAQKTASELNIGHLFVDPDLDERKILGIKLRENIARDLGVYKANEDEYTGDEINLINEASAPFDQLRENEWLRRAINSKVRGSVLFICGFNHVTTFLNLLLKEDFFAQHIGDYTE